MHTLLPPILLLLLPVLVFGAGFEWQIASPESQGMSAEGLETMREALAARNTKAFLVVRNDRIVYEWYSANHSATKKHYTASMAKAIVGGISLGVAMRQGRIRLDDPVSKYIPEWRQDPRKASIAIRHLGSHTSGLEDSVPKDEGGWKQEFWERNDPPRDPFTISRDLAPILFPPGEQFHYSNPGIAMLGFAVTEALRGAPEKDLRSLLRERVMRPIGISDADWSIGYDQTFQVGGLPLVGTWGGGGLTARAAARIGRMILRRGNWDGRAILNPDHVRRTTADAGLPGGNAMGWWTNSRGAFPELPRDAIYAYGAEHQLLLIVPSLNLVAVRNGGPIVPHEPKPAYEQARGEYFFNPLMQTITDVEPVERAAPYPPSEVIQGIEFDFSTHRRLAPGSDNWQLTWADDGHQYAPWGDGGGFGGTNSDGRVSLGVGRVEGTWDDYRGYNVWGGKNAENPATFQGKSWGIVAVDGELYMWVSPRSSLTGLHSESRLHRSSDRGATWEPASWSFTKADRLSVPTICQFGRGYEGARDSYVYHYFVDPVARFLFDHLPPGRIYSARVPKDRIMEREGYEFFAGLDTDGAPRWSSDIAAKEPVYQDPNGTGWTVAVSYNRGLRRYILTTEHVITSQGNLGMFEAPEPWGPWRTVAYLSSSSGTEFGRGHIVANTFFWNVPPKWQSEDGREVTVVFTGAGQGANNDSWNSVRARLR